MFDSTMAEQVQNFKDIIIVNILSWLTGRAIISPWRKRELGGEEGGKGGLSTF